MSMINDSTLTKHYVYVRLSVAAGCDWCQVQTLFVCLFLHRWPAWWSETLILCRPSLFVLTLSVGYILCMLSYSIYWSQISNKLTYLIQFTLRTYGDHLPDFSISICRSNWCKQTALKTISMPHVYCYKKDITLNQVPTVARNTLAWSKYWRSVNVMQLSRTNAFRWPFWDFCLTNL